MKRDDSLSGVAAVDLWRRNAETLQAAGAYDPAFEHDACGVGLVAATDGRPRREVVVAGINALKAVWHRGAVDADGKTGDGAGIHVEIPQDFFKEHIARTGHEPRPGRLGVGMVFLPRTDFTHLERCRSIVESEILNFGYDIYGWRQVPVNVGVIGEKATATNYGTHVPLILSWPGTIAPAVSGRCSPSADDGASTRLSRRPDTRRGRCLHRSVPNAIWSSTT